MALRLGITLTVCVFLASSASGQVVRFETSIGDVDMVLNPTNNSRLQGHVDNMVRYIETGKYNGSWINRADVSNGNPFVLQMGGFYSHTKRPPSTIESTRNVSPFAPITGAPGIPGLSNTVGTVSLALPGSNSNGGTSSFFVNLASNTFLDTNFTVFAAVPDMTVVNQIMALMKLDRTTEPDFGADPGNLAFTDVPVQADGKQVFIKRAFVVTDSMTVAQAMSGVQSVMAQSTAAFGSASNSRSSSAAVPEPTSAVLFLLGELGLMAGFRRRR